MAYFIKPRKEWLYSEAEELHPDIVIKIFESLLIELGSAINDTSSSSVLAEQYFKAVYKAKMILESNK